MQKLDLILTQETRQIVGEIHLDYIPVTHNKREFIAESPLWQENCKGRRHIWNFMRADLVRGTTSMQNSN